MQLKFHKLKNTLASKRRSSNPTKLGCQSIIVLNPTSLVSSAIVTRTLPILKHRISVLVKKAAAIISRDKFSLAAKTIIFSYTYTHIHLTHVLSTESERDASALYSLPLFASLAFTLAPLPLLLHDGSEITYSLPINSRALSLSLSIFAIYINNNRCTESERSAANLS